MAAIRFVILISLCEHRATISGYIAQFHPACIILFYKRECLTALSCPYPMYICMCSAAIQTLLVEKVTKVAAFKHYSQVYILVGIMHHAAFL